MNEANQVTAHIAANLKAHLEKGGHHLQVKDKNGEHVGTVDHLHGDQLKLTRSDSHDGQHHFVPLSPVESRDEVAVYLHVPRSHLN